MFITRNISKPFPWAKEKARDIRLQPTSNPSAPCHLPRLFVSFLSSHPPNTPILKTRKSRLRELKLPEAAQAAYKIQPRLC